MIMDMALALTHGQNLKIMTSRDSREVEHQRQQQQQQGARRRDETRQGCWVCGCYVEVYRPCTTRRQQAIIIRPTLVKAAATRQGARGTRPIHVRYARTALFTAAVKRIDVKTSCQISRPSGTVVAAIRESNSTTRRILALYGICGARGWMQFNFLHHSDDI